MGRQHSISGSSLSVFGRAWSLSTGEKDAVEGELSLKTSLEQW